MSLISRYKAQTPVFFKRIFKYSLILAAAAAANMMAGPLGSAIIPGFTWVLYPWAMSICKYMVVGGVIAAAVAKAAKVESTEEIFTMKKTVVVDDNVTTNVTETNFTKTELNPEPETKRSSQNKQ